MSIHMFAAWFVAGLPLVCTIEAKLKEATFLTAG
jgi:hypothetical protein